MFNLFKSQGSQDSSSTIIFDGKTERTYKIIEIYKSNGRTFQLVCDVMKSAGTIAVNNNYCIQALTENGWVLLADNRILEIPEVNLEMGEKKYKKMIKEGFSDFKKYVDSLF